MKVRPACAAVVSIGTALLLLSGIRCAQAAEIKIVSPSAYEDIEGEGATGEDCCSPYRYQQVFPAADFAALGNQPHWLVGFTIRPDQSLTSPAYRPLPRQRDPPIYHASGTTQPELASLTITSVRTSCSSIAGP